MMDVPAGVMKENNMQVAFTISGVLNLSKDETDNHELFEAVLQALINKVSQDPKDRRDFLEEHLVEYDIID